jgi:hypothetical protein
MRFQTIGLAGFEAILSQPSTSIDLLLSSHVMIKGYAELYMRTPVQE